MRRAASGIGASASMSAPLALLVPLSAIFWWYFEHLDRFVHNWRYVGIDNFSADRWYGRRRSHCFARSKRCPGAGGCAKRSPAATWRPVVLTAMAGLVCGFLGDGELR